MSAADAAMSKSRLQVFYFPNGMVMRDFTPKTTGAAYEMTPILEPLAPYRERFSVITGLAAENATAMGDGAGDHGRCCAAYLTASHPKKTEGYDIRAGVSMDQLVARELGKAYPELGDEFALTSIELGFLTDRRSAFENLATRIDLEAVRGVVTTMIQTEKYGTPLASALRVLSAEFRNERMMRAEEKAARLPAIMTVPLILFILPTLFIVILGPAACSISDNLLKN